MQDFTVRNPDFARVVAASFARQPMMETLGAHLVSVEPGRVVIESDIPDRAKQQQGVAHAGLAFSIGDSAAGYSALSLLPAGQEIVTSEMKIHLLAPGAGERMVAEGRVLRAGRRQLVCEAEVWAHEGAARRLVAKLIGTMVPVPIPSGD
ncbi:PaaI family thioesterase [Maritimibacter sp. DP1N21-5]|uniref:PaaI family thioesterase n=1 Tax=Maritimibacter sp. DP1N21-5 TaxID=2836867 RepID=UPI001C446D61|nr:PaaI family thioesterase [Maritimibacter sp. DP1N21-5]MBV7410589.1 PaaI family thioesterase [Maritimibacter sp. DP1N21-5]